jgi:RimJ/RimL family protein N-acetyltransferase
MTDVIELRTERLVLREWTDADLPAFHALNSHPEVMEFLPGLLTREQSDAFAARIRREMTERSFGLWAVEVVGVVPFVGFVGLSVPSFEAPFMPCVEIGWRLARRHWGNGYANEAALAAMACAFGPLGLDEIVSFTVPANVKSRRVMERIGMERDPRDDFDHPKLPEGHPLRRHVLYRRKNELLETGSG